jgi:hypothetical protein
MQIHVLLLNYVGTVCGGRRRFKKHIYRLDAAGRTIEGLAPRDEPERCGLSQPVVAATEAALITTRPRE